MNPEEMCNTTVAEATSIEYPQAPEIQPEVLPEDYVLQPYDILSGRGRTTFNSVGNRRFRVTLALVLKRYKAAERRRDKTALIKSIVENIRANGGRFLIRKNSLYEEIGDKAAREKVAHALRDMINGSSQRRLRARQGGDHGTRSSAPSSGDSSEFGASLDGHFEQFGENRDGMYSVGGTNESDNDTDEFNQLIAALAATGYGSDDELPLPYNRFG